LVRTRDDMARLNREAHVEDNIQEENYVIPSFISDNEGIPYCTKQTDYDKIIALNLKQRFPQDFEKMLTCLRCDHYKQDDCYFPKSEIEKIEHDRDTKKIKCVLCGNEIHRLFSVLMAYYYKAKFNISMPIICCSCFNALNNNTYLKSIKRRMILFGISLVTSLYFLFTYFLSVLVVQSAMILLILPFAFWGYITVRDMKNMYYLYKGRKYYREIFAKVVDQTHIEKQNAESSSSPPPNNSGNQPSDEDHPDEARRNRDRFNSPGYDY
jgi:transcription elongation factor Elf1